MKIVFLILFIGLSTFSGFGQTAPVNQSEYVKLLYQVEKEPTKVADLIDEIRSRGINFVVTTGLRGLTRTKSKNNEDLRRTLDEADRRRKDPEGTKPPTKAESDVLLAKTKENVLNLLSDMPDFVVKQLISRSEAYAGTGTWRPLDSLVIAVSYHSEKGEQYKVLAKNGAPVSSDTSGSYNGLDGATSGGEFVEDLQKIFKPESKTDFQALTSDTIRGRRAVIYEYEILLVNNKFGGVGLKGPVYSFSPAGEKGRIWIDRETAQVLRIDYKLTDIDPAFAVKGVTKLIDYDTVTIADETYLLPVMSDFRGVVLNGSNKFESRNLIRFRNYQRYGTEVTVIEEDSEPMPDDQQEK